MLACPRQETRGTGSSRVARRAPLRRYGDSRFVVAEQRFDWLPRAVAPLAAPGRRQLPPAARCPGRARRDTSSDGRAAVARARQAAP